MFCERDYFSYYSGRGKGKFVAKIIERARAGYEVEEVAYGKVYTWRPESVVVECECGEETALTQSQTACEGCGAEHKGIVREELSDRQPQGDEDVHPWRYMRDGEENGALPF
jgi:hypothetical protein